jgi:hypothetical protein
MKDAEALSRSRVCIEAKASYFAGGSNTASMT